MNANQMYQDYQHGLDAAAEEIGRVNAMVAGGAGVGKSTLINRVLGARVARTGVGRSVTRELTQLTYPGHPIAIYDTRGFEVKEADKTVADVNAKIQELRRATDAADQIHVAWVCILEQSHRIEPVHRTFLAMLADNRVPAIVVLSQAWGDTAMFDETARLAVPNAGIIPLLAEARTIGTTRMEPFGVDELIDRTLQLLPEAQRLAFICAQNARWDLKEQAVRARIKHAAALAATSAAIPIPGGHSVALAGLQIELIAAINTILGLSLRGTDTKEFFKGFIGIFAAQMGGKAAFGLALSETMKFIPGLGWAGATVIGGSIASVLTAILGNVYLDSVKEFARNEQALPSQTELIERMRHTLEARRAHYADQARDGLPD